MATSQNGWLVYESAPSGALPWITGRVRMGDALTIFTYLCHRFNAEVEPITKGHSWGWAYRSIRGKTSGFSNHASGTAIDLNAPAHPLGKSGTFSKAQVAKIRAILKDLDGVVRWGGDYSGRKDEMHFEINDSPAAVARVAAKLGQPLPYPFFGEKSAKVKRAQELLNKLAVVKPKLAVDSVYGLATKKAVRQFQLSDAELKVDPDGDIGPLTWKKLLAAKSSPTPAPTLPPTPPVAKPRTFRAIDVADHQKVIDWNRVAKDPQGIKGALIKMGGRNRDRKLYVDAYYAKNVAGARAAKMKAAHYFFNGPEDGVSVADWIVKNLQGYRHGDPVVYDCEDDSGNGVKMSVAAAARVLARLKTLLQDPKTNPTGIGEVTPNLYVYTSESPANSMDFSSVAKLGVRLWVAKYPASGKPDGNPKAGAFKAWHIWQYTSKGRVAGVNGDVDMNVVKVGAWTRKTKTVNPNPPSVTPTPPAAPTAKQALKRAHASLQYSDGDKAHTEDIQKLFSQGEDVLTGTEAGPGAGNTSAELKRCAEKYGYRLAIYSRTDCWIAVKKENIVAGSWEQGYNHIIDNAVKRKDVGHRHGDKGIVWVRYTHKTLGPQSEAANHLLTKARTPGMAKQDDPKCPESHYLINKRYCDELERWIKAEQTAGRMVWVSADWNMLDKQVSSWVPSLLTCWNETGKYPNTGHGNIDSIGRGRGSKALKCVSAGVKSDKGFFLHTDHFLVEAIYRQV